MTGDVTATDPICELSPHHHLVAPALEEAAQGDPAAGLARHTVRRRRRLTIETRSRRSTCAGASFRAVHRHDARRYNGPRG